MIGDHVWRGNIRELENVIKRALVLAQSGPILPDHLPDHMVEKSTDASSTNDLWEKKLRELIREYLSENKWQDEDDLHDRLIQSLEKPLFELLLDHYSRFWLVDVRVLAATNQNLEELIEQKRFREDLYHRLNVIRIQIPPLRERKEDIPVLLRLFLQQAAKEIQVESKILLADVEAYLSGPD